MNEELRVFFQDAANIATSLAIPAAIATIVIYFNDRARARADARAEQEAGLADHKAQRLSQQQEIDGDLKENYYDILKILIHKPYLDEHEKPLENPRQQRQQKRIYEYIVSLFETAHMRLADEPDFEEMWNSWEDYINEWLGLPNFRSALPELLVGENADFVRYMEKKMAASGQSSAPRPAPAAK